MGTTWWDTSFEADEAFMGQREHQSTVEVLAEAEEDTLNVFLQQVNQHFSQYIQDVNIEWLPASGEFRDFEVKF